MNEYEIEPIPGLPEELPPGERLLWQGAPRWRELARRAYYVRAVAIYFALILGWIAVVNVQAGEPLSRALLGGGWILVLAHVAVGLLLLLAWLASRATVYTITNRRVVMRIGVAISMAVNLPFKQIRSAALREHGNGIGDIPLTVAGRPRLSYLVLWPHVRPWRFSQVQPMLRCVPDARRVAGILADAMTEYASASGDVDETAANDADANAPDPGADESSRCAAAQSV